jgi:hypothetical protein
MLLKALRTAEDALWRQNISIMKFTDDTERIVNELWTLARSGRGTTKANRAKHEAADALHAEWQALRDQGHSAPTVATHYGVTPETVYRTTKKRKP